MKLTTMALDGTHDLEEIYMLLETNKKVSAREHAKTADLGPTTVGTTSTPSLRAAPSGPATCSTLSGQKRDAQSAHRLDDDPDDSKRATAAVSAGGSESFQAHDAWKVRKRSAPLRLLE